MNIMAAEEAEYVRAKTSVWWDIENCEVPKGCDAREIAQKLSSALMKKNYCGPLSISSYGNTNCIPNSIQIALSSTGIDLNHVPSGKKNASDKKILVDMLLWVVENPAPANIMLISGDGDFSDALHRLRMRRYNILLAHPQDAAATLVSSAKTTWLWGSSLLGSSRVLDNRHYPSGFGISEQGLSKQSMGSKSSTSRTARNKPKVIYVPKASNQFMQQETIRRKKLQMSPKFRLEQKQNLKLLDEPENMVARPNECLEKDVEMANKMADAKVVTRSCSVFPGQTAFDSAAMVKAEALIDIKNIEESVQDNDLQSRDGQESMKCLEEENKELVETCTTFECSGIELRQVFKERLESEGGAPLNIDCVVSELSRDFRLPIELREFFEAILKKLEPSTSEIVIEKLKEGLEIKSGEPEDAPARLTEHLEEDMNKKKSGVIEDKTEAYCYSICSVICDCPTIFNFESHLNDRKHTKKSKESVLAYTLESWCELIKCMKADSLILKQAMLDGKQIEEEVIQDNGHMIEEIRSQPGEAHEYIDCLEKQIKELEENENKPLPNEECIFTELNPGEEVDAIIKKLELSQDATLTSELESIAKQNLEMNSCDPESNSGGAIEHPVEYMDKTTTKKKDKVTEEAYVCSICSVICHSPIFFESHLMGQRHRHAARVKKREEVPFDDKKILEESLQEKDHAIDALHELRLQADDVKESIKEGLENESEVQLRDAECFFTKPKPEKRKKNGAAAWVCDWCNVMCSSQVDFDSHLAGKKHAAVAVLKKQAATTITYVRKSQA